MSDKKIDSSIFWNPNKLNSYDCMLNFVLGERGVGKSYSLKKYVTNRFIKKGKQFVYIRRYKTELQKAVGTKENPKFFEQIKNEFPNNKLSNSADTFYIDGKVSGYAVPLSTANILKSSTFEGVDTIIFDEFIIDKGSYHYLSNEVIQFLDILESIGRLRDIKVFLLGNSISITNPYFAFFDLHLPYNSDIALFKNGSIAVCYIKNLAYREIKKKTKFGSLIADTEYGRYAIDNEFLRDSKAFIKKKSGNCKFFFTMILNGVTYGIWINYQEELIYISKDYDPKCPTILTFNIEDHSETTELGKIRSNGWFKCIVDHYRLGKLCFESQQIKNLVMDKISRTLTY